MKSFLFRIECAVKTSYQDSHEGHCEMLEEAKAMIRVTKHDHIVNLQGISQNQKRIYVLLEFCPKGNIRDFLSHDSSFNDKPLHGNFENLLNWCSQVADAMTFLVENKIRLKKLKLRPTRILQKKRYCS